MAFLGNLVVNLTANSAGFNKGIAQAQQQLEAFVAVAGAAAVAAGALAVRTFASMGDELDKLSQRTGVGVEALSELQFAAKRGGTDLNAVEAAIRRMSATVRDAGLGLSTATDAFDDLGVSFEQLEGLSVESQFDAITSALGNIDHAGERAAVTMKVFGRSGTALLPMIRTLDSTRDEAHKLGQVITELEAKQAAALTDSLGDLGGALSFVFFKIGSQLAPVVKLIADRFTAFSQISDTQAKVLIVLGSALVGASAAYLGIAAAAKAAAAAQAFALALSGPKGWIAVGAAVTAATAAVWAMNEAAGTTADTVADITDAVGDLDDAIPPGGIEIFADPFQQRMSKARDIMEDMRSPLEKLEIKAHDLETTLRGLFAPNIIRDFKAEVFETGSGFSDMFADVTDELRVLKGEITETGLKFEKFLEQGVAADRVDELRRMVEEADRLKAAADEAGKAQAAAAPAAAAVSIVKSAGANKVGAGGFNLPSGPRLAGAAERGSAEAMRQILLASGRQSPEVKAIEKQTKDLGKEFKNAVGELVGDGGKFLIQAGQ